MILFIHPALPNRLKLLAFTCSALKETPSQHTHYTGRSDLVDTIIVSSGKTWPLKYPVWCPFFGLCFPPNMQLGSYKEAFASLSCGFKPPPVIKPFPICKHATWGQFLSVM